MSELHAWTARSVRRFLLGVVLVAAALLAIVFVDSVGAAEIGVSAPAEVTVGDDVTVVATVTDEAGPVEGAEVTLSFLGRILDEAGWVPIATGVTDENGSVTFDYAQRALDASRMRVEQSGPDGQDNIEFTISILEGPQLHTSDAGADLPIFGVWWILAVLGIVWVLILIAVVRLVKIGKSATSATASAVAIPRIMVGFVALTALGMFVVVITKPQSHANLDPTADFDRTPRAVVSEDYEYPGLGSDDPNADRSELDGRELFVQSGCASCHGVTGGGAIVGGEIAGPEHVETYSELLEQIREGPKGMPVYGPERLTDEEVAEIHDYLARANEP